DWKSNATLFLADQFSAPGSFRTLRAAGEQYLLQYAGNVNSPDSSKLLNQAADLFTRSKDIRPTENAFIGLGNVSYIRKDYPRATDFFKEALKLRPNNQLAKERITACYRDWGKYEGQVKNNLSAAVENLNHALEYIPDDNATLRLLGTAYGLQNKHAEAVACYEKALLKAPNDKELLRNLSVGYRLLGDNAKADSYAKQAGM
ncbi:MAG: tetratricopeptide repeat protein, partial [Bacteroidota bacterium]